MSELVLGTAQLGNPYGVTNQAGRLSDTDVESLLRRAVDAGVSLFDTAAAYGDAQARLGRLMPAEVTPRYITKVSMATADRGNPGAEVREAARQLGVDHLDGVLLHQPSELGAPGFSEYVDVLRALRDEGLIGAIGLSVYDEHELTVGLAAIPDAGIVQFPASIVDSRLLGHPLVAELRAGGVTVHVRSVFLQGLLLSDSKALPERFSVLAPVLTALDAAAAEQGVSRLAVIVAGVRDAGVDGVIVGATSHDELDAIAAAWATPAVVPTLVSAIPTEILDPRRWHG